MSSAIYDSNDQLRPEKGKWCAECHDDGTVVIDDVPAPNVPGKSMSGDWQSPASVMDSNFPDAENLLNNDLSIGLVDYHGTYVLFDLGSPGDISHIRLYAGAGSDNYGEVYGGNDRDNHQDPLQLSLPTTQNILTTHPHLGNSCAASHKLPPSNRSSIHVGRYRACPFPTFFKGLHPLPLTIRDRVINLTLNY